MKTVNSNIQKLNSCDPGYKDFKGTLTRTCFKAAPSGSSTLNLNLHSSNVSVFICTIILTRQSVNTAHRKVAII